MLKYLSAILKYFSFVTVCPHPFSVRKDIQTKKSFQFGHCPNYPNPHPPIRATLPTFSGRQKRRFARMAEKILMMIIIVAMIILIKILVILMIMMTKNTEKPTNIVNFG